MLRDAEKTIGTRLRCSAPVDVPRHVNSECVAEAPRRALITADGTRADAPSPRGPLEALRRKAGKAGLDSTADERPDAPALNVTDARSRQESFGNDDAVSLYLREISRVPLLSAEAEIALAQQRDTGKSAAAKLAAGVDDLAECARLTAVAAAGHAAEHRLISSNLRLVVSIARKHARRGLPLPDLIQEGNIGLHRAVERYDWRLGYRFSTYAFWWIRQAIDRAISDQARLIRLPNHVVETLGQLRLAARELVLRLEREPTIAELADHVDMDVRRVRVLLRVASVQTSLDAPIDDAGDLKIADLIADTHEVPTPLQVERDVLADELDEALSRHLSMRELFVIRSRYGLRGRPQQTFAEIGEQLGVSRERVRQIEIAAIRKLRHAAPVLRLFHDFAS